MAELKYEDLISDKEISPKEAQRYFLDSNKMSDEEIKSVTKEILTQKLVMPIYGPAGIKPEEVGDFIAKIQESRADMDNIIAGAYTALGLGEMSNKADGIIDEKERFAVTAGFAQRYSSHMQRFKRNQKKPNIVDKFKNKLKEPFKKMVESVQRVKISFGPARIISTGDCDNVQTAYVPGNNKIQNITRTSGPRDL